MYVPVIKSHMYIHVSSAGGSKVVVSSGGQEKSQGSSVVGLGVDVGSSVVVGASVVV